MTDQWRTRLMLGTMVLNSVLLGVLAALVCISVVILCVVIDQDFRNGYPLPPITEWVMAIQPKEEANVAYFASTITVTCLFLIFYFRIGSERPSGPALCLSLMFTQALLAGVYFLVCVLGLALPKITLLRGLGPSMEKRLQHSRMHHRPKVVSAELGGALAGGYAISLLALGLSIKRHRARSQ